MNFRHIEIGESDPEIAHLAEQRRDAGALVIRVERIDQLMAFIGQFEIPFGEPLWHRVHRIGEFQRQLPLAEFAHDRGGFLDNDDLAAPDHADAISHLLGLFDIMGRQNDRNAAFAQAAYKVPHAAPKLDIDTRRRLVEKQDFGFMAQCLGDHHPALHPTRQFHDLRVAFVPERKILQQLLDIGLVARLAEQATAEIDRRPNRLESIGADLLRHEPDHPARFPVAANDIVSARKHRARCRRNNAADRTDQSRLARAIGPEQCEDLARNDIQTDIVERLNPAIIGLAEV